MNIPVMMGVFRNRRQQPVKQRSRTITVKPTKEQLDAINKALQEGRDVEIIIEA